MHRPAPTGATEKKPSGANPWLTAHCEATSVDALPSKVVMPPKTDAYESGIISCASGTPILTDQPLTNGISIATTGTWFMSPQHTQTSTINRSCAMRAELGFPSNGSTRRSRIPEFSNARATMFSEPTTTKAGLLNPANASVVVMMPKAARKSVPPNSRDQQVPH